MLSTRISNDLELIGINFYFIVYMSNRSSNHVYYQFLVCMSGFIHIMSLRVLVDNTDLAFFQGEKIIRSFDLVDIDNLMLYLSCITIAYCY